MRHLKLLMAAITAVLIISPVLAADFGDGASICDSVFSQVSGLTKFNAYPSPSSYKMGGSAAMLNLSLLIILVVLTALSLAYAVGIAFGINSLKEFVKKEYVESIFNIVFIVLIVGGLGFAGGAMSFFTNVANVALKSSGMSSPPTITSASDLYLNICANYLNNGIFSSIQGVIYIIPTLYFAKTLQGITITLEPLDIGFEFRPYAGIYPYVQILNLETDLFVLVLGLEVSMSLVLATIYFLFPIFLYAGILLRSFPWTRARRRLDACALHLFLHSLPCAPLPLPAIFVPSDPERHARNRDRDI